MYVYIMYICDISVIHVCILIEELCFELSFGKHINISLKLQKPSVSRIYSVGFNHDAELPYKK